MHPVLKHLIALHELGKLEEWLNAMAGEETEQVKIDADICVSKATVHYYHRHFQLLKEKGYFNKVEKVAMGSNQYKAEDIKRSLANTRQIVFEVTESCNLKCTYCGFGDLYDGFDKREDKNLDIESAKKLLDYVLDLLASPLNRQYFKKFYVSFYGGEPLLNMPFIEEIVNYVKGKTLHCKSFCFSMTTNAVLLDKYMKFLADNDFSVTISLDGNKENNEYRHFADGNFSFDKVYGNILKLKENYPDYFKKSIHFISVIHDKNSNKEVKAFFEKEFQREPMLVEVNSLGIKPAKRAEFEKLFKSTYSGFEDQSIIAATQTKHELLKTPFVAQLWSFLRGSSDLVFRQYDPLIRKPKNLRAVSTGTCSPFSRKIFLTAKGVILPCERISHVYSLGSVDKNGVHLDYEAIAAKVNKYYEKMMPQCNRCTINDNCSNCIYSIDLNDDNPSCKNIMDRKKFKENLQLQLSTLEETRQYYPEIMRHYVVN